MPVNAPAPISVWARLVSGVVVPLVFFLAWQGLLIALHQGHGSWGGMMVFFASLFVVPALAVLNIWVVLVRWRGAFRACFAGLALPAAFGALEALVIFGSGRTLAPLESALESPLVPFVAIAFASPLIVAIIMAIGRQRRERRARLA